MRLAHHRSVLRCTPAWLHALLLAVLLFAQAYIPVHEVSHGLQQDVVTSSADCLTCFALAGTHSGPLLQTAWALPTSLSFPAPKLLPTESAPARTTLPFHSRAPPLLLI